MTLTVTGGCIDLVATTDTDPIAGTTATTDPGATTGETSTTTTTTSSPTDPTISWDETTAWPTTGTPSGPEPLRRCKLVAAPDLLAAACDGEAACRIREAQRLECEGAAFYHHLVRAPDDSAALYVQTRAEPTFGVQHEAHLLTPEGSWIADVWVTGSGFGPAGNLLPWADQHIELWHQDGQSSPVTQYLPYAAVDLEGYSIATAVRDDIAWFVGTTTRPDDVPMARFTLAAGEGLHALYDLPGGRVEQPLIVAEAWTMWLHDVAGTLRMSWADWDSQLGGMYLYVRDLEADPLLPGTPLVRVSDSIGAHVHDAVLSSFGDGNHGVVFADGPSLIANAPWTYQETLGGAAEPCPAPSCEDGCEAAPTCLEARVQAHPVALQDAPASVRAWHIECPHDVTLSWEEDSYFDLLCLCDKCRCGGVIEATVEKSCELVASALAPDPNAADQLLRTEQWRRPLGFERDELIVDAVVGDQTLWLMTMSSAPTPQIVVWAVDTE